MSLIIKLPIFIHWKNSNYSLFFIIIKIIHKIKLVFYKVIKIMINIFDFAKVILIL